MREQIEHRPALAALFGLTAGLATAQWLPLAVLFVGLFAALKSLRTRGIATALFAVGVVIWPGLHTPDYQPKSEIEGIFTVASMPRVSRGGQIAEVENDTGRYRFIYEKPVLSLGDVVRLRGVLKGVSEVQEPYFKSKGLSGSISVSSLEDIQIVRKGPAILRAGLAWRESFLEFTEKGLPAEVAQMADALCFNVDGELPDTMRDSLQRTGTIHIISASGLHVFLFSLAIQYLLAFLPMPRWMQFVLLILVLALYAAAAGFRPPVVRAAFMGVAYMGSEFVKRVPDALSSLSLVGIGYLLWRPLTLLDIGFQLSFVAVFALSYFRLYERSSVSGAFDLIRVRAGHGLWQSVVATVATAPLIAYHFGMVSAIAVLANLLIVLAILPIMVGAMLAWAVSFVLPILSSGILVIVVAPFIGWVSFVVSGLAEVPLASVEVPSFHALWLVPIYLAMFVAWRPRVRQA